MYSLTVFTFFCSDLSQCCGTCITEAVSMDLFGILQIHVLYVYWVVKVFSYGFQRKICIGR